LEEKVLRKLEFPKIIKLLTDRCSFQLGKELAEDLKPSLDGEEIKKWQSETTQAKEVLRLYPGFSIGGVRDIRQCLGKAKLGGIVEPGDFLQIDDTLLATRKTKEFFRGDGQKYAFLAVYVHDLPAFPRLEQEIKQKITAEGEVSDRASAELFRLRKQLRSLQGRAREKLESMIRSPELQKYLQDPLITIRNERFVIPVKQEYRAQVPGLIHDQSGSGATLFVEPLAVVELNNETQRYEAMEKAEVTRILRELSQLTAAHYEELLDVLQRMAQLDFMLAKGKLSSDLDCGEPVINEQGYLKIVQGRHPLIKGKVVPVTIYLGNDFDTLVITGPNTGGKTVTLKTVGLFVLMAQSGLHVPAQEGTDLAVYEGIFADIGDEQSIEQSLSTFSAHMTNIIHILGKVNGRSLVLLDELGAGTDPTEGAALAMAILQHLIGVGAQTIATTHYSELKTFAYNQERVENASVEFDVETLRPTYRLLIGVPGKSNAFEISRRLGLPMEVVNQAKGYLSQEEVRVADLIENLETNQLLSERKRQEAEKMHKNARDQLVRVEEKEEELNRKVEDIIQKAQQEALEIVTRARRESEDILKEVRTVKKKMETEAPQNLQALRDQLREKEGQLSEAVFHDMGEAEVTANELAPGDLVLIKRIRQKAQVLERPNANGEVLVQSGIMKLTVQLKDLRKIDEEKFEEKKRPKSGIGGIVSAKAREVKNELHLRGLTVEEAVLETEKYLDDAYLAGLPQAYLIHGKGTGALRNAITELVKNHRFVASFRIGSYHEGGHGVTVVEFIK
jgi:DNA mismatch repair protein MutS2